MEKGKCVECGGVCDKRCKKCFEKASGKKMPTGWKRGNKFGVKFKSKEKHHAWNGGYKYYKSGSGRVTYRRIKINGKYIAEHRYKMEQHLKRKLSTKEIVHHKDGDGLNNDIDNLKVVSWGEHNRLHKKGGVAT